MQVPNGRDPLAIEKLHDLMVRMDRHGRSGIYMTAVSAIDCALWDLEAQLAGTSAWELAGVKPEPVHTVFTIGLEDEPEQMAAGAAAATDISLFKIKLNNDRPVERIAAIRAARPDVRLVVDVLCRELSGGGSRKRPYASQHLLINDSQAILVTVNTRMPVEHLRRRVGRRKARHHRLCSILDVFDKSKVGHLDVSTDNQQVFRFDIEVLQGVFVADEVQSISRIA